MNDRPWEPWIRRAKSNLARANTGNTQRTCSTKTWLSTLSKLRKISESAPALAGCDCPPRTHSIGYLLNMIERNCDIPIPHRVRDAVVLSDYAVTTRYPGDYECVSEEEYRLAVELADAVWTWVTSVIEYY